MGISVVTEERVNGDNDAAIEERLLFCNYTPDFEDFSILDADNSDFKVTLIRVL